MDEQKLLQSIVQQAKENLADGEAYANGNS
jgi:hypothetical protein